MKRFAREGHERFTKCFVLSGVRVKVRRDVFGVCFPIDNHLGLTEQFANACPDHVNADYRSVDNSNDLDRACGLENVALSVAGQVVVVNGNRCVAVLLFSRSFGQTNRRDFGA